MMIVAIILMITTTVPMTLASDAQSVISDLLSPGPV